MYLLYVNLVSIFTAIAIQNFVFLPATLRIYDFLNKQWTTVYKMLIQTINL